MSGRNRHPLVEHISRLHSMLYRKSDLGMGGLHAGIFMFRDIFALIRIPMIFGRVGIDPFKCTDLNETQLQWLGSRPATLNMYLDQFVDMFDFAGGMAPFGGYTVPDKKAFPTFRAAAFHMQAAAAALSVAFDRRGAIQSSLLATELSLKAGLASRGWDEKRIRSVGHDLGRAAREFGASSTGFDEGRVLKVVENMPDYVQNRYSSEQPSRVETGHIAMGAQYVAGEVMRQVAGHSIGPEMRPGFVRAYPQN